METKQESSHAPGTRKRKRVLIAVAVILSVLIVLFAVVFMVAYYRGSNMIKAYLEAKVSSQTRGLYTLKMKDLNLFLFPGRLKIEGLELVPDTARYSELKKTDTVPSVLLTLRIGKLVVTDLDIYKVIHDKKIELKKILVNAPDIRIDEYDKPAAKNEKKEKHQIKLALNLPKGISLIDIREIRLLEGKMLYCDHRKDTLRETAIPEFSIEIDNIHIDSTLSGHIFNADDIRVTLKGLQKRTKNGMFTVMLGEVGLSTGKGEVYIKDFHLKPESSQVDFGRKMGFQTDWMEVKAGKITFTNLNIPELILNERFHADRLTLEKLDVADYRDKRNPMRKNFHPKMPHQALTALTAQVRIDSVFVSDGRISYSEQTGERAGTIYFTDVSGVASPVTNDSSMIATGFTMNVNASLKLMGTAPLNVVLLFPMPAKNGVFYFSGTLSNLDLTKLNPFISALIPVKITSGIVDKLVIPPVFANDKNSRGKLTMYYHDLVIDMPPQTDKTWEGLKKSVLSWAANTYVSESNPSKNGKLREGVVYFNRDPNKSIFNYLWKSVFSGIKSTVNVNTKEQKEIKKQEKKNKH